MLPSSNPPMWGGSPFFNLLFFFFFILSLTCPFNWNGFNLKIPLARYFAFKRRFSLNSWYSLIA